MNRNHILPELLEWQKKGKYITTFNDHKVFVIDDGDSTAQPEETLVAFHGFPESSATYRFVSNFFLTRFKRVIYLDFVGFGFSDKPKDKLNDKFTFSIFEHTDTVLWVLQELKVRGAHFLSHDMGDSILTELMTRVSLGQPNWMDKGILSVTFTNGGMVLEEAEFRLAQKLLLSPFGKYLTVLSLVKPFFFQQIFSAHGNSLIPKIRIEEMYNQLIYKGYLQLSYYLIQYQKERIRFEKSRWLPVVASCNYPIHLAWGTDDKVNPVGIARYLKKIQPKAQLTEIEGVGHFCQLHNEEVWFASLDEFWKKLV
ncbi:MAG: hypothetical protein C4K58_06590 [Flavobacteriaceae bacterium]|nr:MAG: hypothetical protein C4K58_06590 [Flavobacteriaceae bacterium]